MHACNYKALEVHVLMSNINFEVVIIILLIVTINNYDNNKTNHTHLTCPTTFSYSNGVFHYKIFCFERYHKRLWKEKNRRMKMKRKMGMKRGRRRKEKSRVEGEKRRKGKKKRRKKSSKFSWILVV